MTSTTPGKEDGFPWRYVVYLVIFAYLAGDLYFFNGPIRRKINSRRAFTRESKEFAEKYGVVVLVNREPITRPQLDLAVKEHLHRRGRTPEDLSENDLKITKLAVVQDLVNGLLVTQHCRGQKFRVPDEVVDSFVDSFERQFASPDDLAARSESLQLDAGSRRELLERIITEKYWIEHRIGPAVVVTDEEARRFYETNRENGAGGFVNPERFRASQIFLSTVTEPDREEAIREIHRQLAAGGEEVSGFSRLAAQHSEDQRSRDRGGNLGWFTAGRMPPDFMEAIEPLQKGDLSAPFRTSIGWHIVEMTGREPAGEIDFETLEPEIVAYLTSKRRQEKLTELHEKLRQVAAIEFFPQNL